jgi:hypothetical protein
MSDIVLKLRAEALGKTIKNLSLAVETEINDAVRNLAVQAHNAMVARLQGMSANTKNQQDYLKNLKLDDLGDNSYLIHLDGDWANKLESGFGPYSIRDQLLKSQKVVQVGPRAGQPWVREAKDGHKWAVVPFEHKPHANPTGDLGSTLKGLMAKGTNGVVQPLSKTFKDIDGNAISGKVATLGAADTDKANLKGLVKYQHVSLSGKVSSLYVTYRAVSENGKDWQHPGFSGYKLFEEAQKYVESEIDNIINTLLK